MKFHLLFNLTLAKPLLKSSISSNQCSEMKLPFTSMKFHLLFNLTPARPFLSKLDSKSNHCPKRNLPSVLIKFHFLFNLTLARPFLSKLSILSNPLKSPFLAKDKAFSNFSLNTVDGLNTS